MAILSIYNPENWICGIDNTECFILFLSVISDRHGEINSNENSVSAILG